MKTEEQKAMEFALVKAAHHVDQGLRFLYGMMFEREGHDFDWFVAPIRGDRMGVNPTVFAEVEAIVFERDPAKLQEMGDSYYHSAMWLAYALVQMAMHHNVLGVRVLAWEQICSAHMWMGLINGRMRRAGEEGHAKSKAGHRLNDIIHAESRSSKEEAMAWYDDHRDEFSSDDDRALAITKKWPYEFSTVRKWIVQHRSKRK